jgi:thiamine-phosphate pyrophosphorylase
MAKEANTNEINRCRLILTANPLSTSSENLITAASAGDVASVILYAAEAEPHVFEAFCKDVTPQLQEADCAVLIADDTQAFGRCGADGLFAEKEKSKLEDFIARFSPQNIVGCGNIKARHNALEIGELKPDFIFFGKTGGDIKPEAHPKNIKLAEWWAELVEIPGIVMGGSALNSIIEVAKTGIDFVALEKAIFANGDAAKNVVEANSLLDAHAPLFDEDEE